jgi:hypothetical protein
VAEIKLPAMTMRSSLANAAQRSSAERGVISTIATAYLFLQWLTSQKLVL